MYQRDSEVAESYRARESKKKRGQVKSTSLPLPLRVVSLFIVSERVGETLDVIFEAWPASARWK